MKSLLYYQPGSSIAHTRTKKQATQLSDGTCRNERCKVIDLYQRLYPEQGSDTP